MELILWRHAEAEVGEPDLGRKLTARGDKQARRVAQWLHGQLPDSARILTSPAERALQTAQALADLSRRKLRIVDTLAPGLRSTMSWRVSTGRTPRSRSSRSGISPSSAQWRRTWWPERP